MIDLRLHPRPSWQDVTIRGPIVSLPHGSLTRPPAPVSRSLAVATGLHLSGLWGGWYTVAGHPRAHGMPHRSPPDDRDGRHDPGEDPDPAEHLVCSGLAGDDD